MEKRTALQAEVQHVGSHGTRDHVERLENYRKGRYVWRAYKSVWRHEGRPHLMRKRLVLSGSWCAVMDRSHPPVPEVQLCHFRTVNLG